MRRSSSSSGMQWAAVALSWAMVTAAIAYPEALPGPLRDQVDQAVSGAARLWLWSWSEPADLLNLPETEWGPWGFEPGGELTHVGVPAAPGGATAEPVGVGDELPGSSGFTHSFTMPLIGSAIWMAADSGLRAAWDVIGRCGLGLLRRLP